MPIARIPILQSDAPGAIIGAEKGEGDMHFLYKFENEDLYYHHALDKQPAAGDFFRHAHEMCEVYGFIRGKGVYTVEGTPYPLGPGDILIMRPAEFHTLSIDTSQPYERISFNFSPAILAGSDPEGLLLEPFFSRPLGRENLYHAKAFPEGSPMDLLREMSRRQPERGEQRLHIICCLFPLLAQIRRAYKQKNADLAAGSGRAAQIIAYINENLTGHLSLEKLSADLFLSKSQITRLVRRAAGCSAGEYITVKRLLLARRRMQAGEPPTAVWAACGFGDYSAFYRAYRKYYGASPSGKGRGTRET